jgi:Ca2+-binding RTX toxin-like protein
MARLIGTPGDDTLNGTSGDDTFRGGLGDDLIRGRAGDDTAFVNVSTDGSDTVDLGNGEDEVRASLDGPGQIRLTFTSSEVGNGDPFDSNSMRNQDGGLAVRLQAENGSDGLTGPVSRYEDEGITFVADSPGVTFDVRDLVSGVQRGDEFRVVRLGTAGGDQINEEGENRSYYINAGMGNDTVSGSEVDDFLVGGAGNDILRGRLGDDSFIGGGGNDTIRGGDGDDVAIFNVSTDGSDTASLGDGDDVVLVNKASPGQIRLTFTSSEVGNDDANDSNTLANQDEGLAVRLQAEDGSDGLSGPVSRFDDEGITFVATAPGVTFDVRDLVTGAERGDEFEVVQLGTVENDRISQRGEDRAYYINAGMGDDTVTGGEADDFLVGGAGDDVLRGRLGDDTFIGGTGNDTLGGGGGADSFIFNAPLNPAANVDQIDGFSVTDDTIRLDTAVFTGLPDGPLDDAAFARLADMGEADDRIVYDQVSGSLFFDEDGGTREDLVLFARLANSPNNLSADDFVVI